jgi:hypothetical protein
MATASYRIVRQKDGWAVRHGAEISQAYSTREAAFEAAIPPASNAIKSGDAVAIEVDAPDKNEPALG